MSEAAKLPIFQNDCSTEDGILRLQSNDLPFTLSRIQAAGRPDGFRRSKHIAIYLATGDGFEVQGDGESLVSEAEAVAKAKSEALERLCMKIHAKRFVTRDTSNGWAAHTSLSAANMNAALELFERDAALVHWLRSSPLVEIVPLQLPMSVNWWKWTELARSEFPQLKVMLTTDGYFPAVVALFKNKAGHGIIGTASSTNLARAIDSALTEACRSALHFIRGTYSEEAAALLAGRSLKVRPGAHTTLYARDERLPEWFSAPTKRISWKNASAECSTEMLSAAIRGSQMCFELVATSGERFVVKANSSKLQPIFWGPSSESNEINFERIARTRNTINPLPHVVG